MSGRSRYRIGECFFFAMIFFRLADGGEVADDEYFNALVRGNVKVTTLSRTVNVSSKGESRGILEIFCYQPMTSASIFKFWMSTSFEVQCKGSCALYFGKNASLAYRDYRNPMFSIRHLVNSMYKRYYVYPFEGGCLAVDASVLPFTVKFEVEEWNSSLVMASVFGFLMFFLARCFSRATAFQYMMGTLTGVFLFALVSLWFLSKLFSSSSRLFFLALASTGTFAIFTRWILGSLGIMLDSYLDFFLAYLAVATITSFSFCYVRGPLTNPRTVTLLQWFLQAVSLLVIYQSISYAPYGIAVCAVMFVSNLLDSTI